MSQLVPHRLNGREDRRVNRELALLDGQARSSLARVELTADIHTARVHGLAHVGRQALHAAALVTETEEQLSRLVPAAGTRLTAIGDITTLGLGQLVAD